MSQASGLVFGNSASGECRQVLADPAAADSELDETALLEPTVEIASIQRERKSAIPSASST
jgi:hypothetical protein